MFEEEMITETEVEICKNMVNHLLSELQQEKMKYNSLFEKMNTLFHNNEKSLQLLNQYWADDYEKLEEYCYQLEKRLEN